MALMLDREGSVPSRHATCLIHARLLHAGCRMNSILTEGGKWGDMGGRAGTLVIETVKVVHKNVGGETELIKRTISSAVCNSLSTERLNSTTSNNSLFFTRAFSACQVPC